MKWYLAVLERYAVFDGRARRREYWSFTLIHLLIVFSLAMLLAALEDSSAAGSAVVGVTLVLYALATFVPSVAVTVRRLHDTGTSGWWYFVSLVPVFGPIALLIFMVLDGEPSDNEYGPNPKAGELASLARRSITA